ncbi:MAG: hypothetical protein NTY12_02315 [Candidatus Falkowbacteria bacterium]|nr:hypothetical protein [Candidatus Falkowbacteria bacterium]
MNELKHFEPIEKNTYEIKKENIIPLYSLPEDFSEDLKSLDWPLEVQGTGRLLEDNKNFEIRYPKGDMFYSWAVVFHELGHLLQDKLSLKIKIEENDQTKAILKEEDAFVRGLGRVQKYCPDILEVLDERFNYYKKQGKLPSFNSFTELYKDFFKIIKINETLNVLKEGESELEALEKVNIQSFFNDIEDNKVGVTIDEEEVELVVLKVVDKLIEEQAV